MLTDEALIMNKRCELSACEGNIVLSWSFVRRYCAKNLKGKTVKEMLTKDFQALKR